MKFKNTFEILIKDIQDIEKLVVNLQNSKEGNTIELDLALSKLRNVYEILALIRSDQIQQLRRAESGDAAKAATPGEEEAAESPEEEAAKSPERESSLTHMGETGKPAGGTGKLVTGVHEAKDEPSESFSAAKSSSAAEPSILAERFSAGSSINDHMAGDREKKPDSKYLGQPIESISRNIGINDRFLIIRELFDGDADRFSHLVRQLDEAENHEQASRLLDQAFHDHPEHDGIDILKGLVKRRYSLQ